jgi:hypothetical protein
VSFAPDGTLYVVADYFSLQSVDEVGGTGEPQPATVTPTGVRSTYSAAASGSNVDGGAKALLVGAVNKGGFEHSLAAYDMTASPPSFSATLVQSDVGAVKIIGPDGCLYLTDASKVFKVSNGDGSCPLAGLAPNPSVVLVPEIAPASVSQGTPVTFDVTFPHSTLAEGTPVQYAVCCANHFSGQTLVGADNSASFTYAGPLEGVDTVVAYAVIDAAPVASNPVPVRWFPNKHSTLLSLDTNRGSGEHGSPVVVSATLLDVAHVPILPVPGATIQFALTGQSCSAVTNAAGFASCALTLAGAAQCTLTASFDGNSSYLPTSASQLFTVSPFDLLFANGFEPSSAPAGGGCIVY